MPSLLFKALALCVQAHHNQTDRDGMPHALHCIRVAEKQTTEERMAVALLHDVAEDTDVPVADLAVQFGDKITAKVLRLTREEGEPYAEYILRVCADRDCMLVKKADIEDNTRVDRVDLKAAAKMPMYKEAYDVIMKRLSGQGVS